MIERERIFEPTLGELAGGEHGARIVDQDIDTGLRFGDFGGNPLHFRNARQIGIMDRMGKAGRFLGKPLQGPSPRDLSLATRTIRAPIWASFSAATPPMPEVAPVMTTVLPCMNTLPRYARLTFPRTSRAPSRLIRCPQKRRKVSRALADLAVSGAQVTSWQSLRFAIQICTAPGLNPRFARLAYLKGGDDIRTSETR